MRVSANLKMIPLDKQREALYVRRKPLPRPGAWKQEVSERRAMPLTSTKKKTVCLDGLFSLWWRRGDGNGAGIGKLATRQSSRPTARELLRAPAVSCAAAAGMATRPSARSPSGTASTRTNRTATSGSCLCAPELCGRRTVTGWLPWTRMSVRAAVPKSARYP